MQHSVYKSASLPQQSFDMSAPQFASMAVDASHQSGMAHLKILMGEVDFFLPKELIIKLKIFK